METDIYSYLDKDYQSLSMLSKEMNEELFTAPHSVILKGRLFIEGLTKEIAILEKVERFNTMSLAERLLSLKFEGHITGEINDYFHTVRILGNKVAHEGIEEELEIALKIHKSIYKIIGWFIETYVNYRFITPPYKNPLPTNINKSNEEGLLNKFIGKFADLLAKTQQGNNDKNNAVVTDIIEPVVTVDNNNIEIAADNNMDIIHESNNDVVSDNNEIDIKVEENKNMNLEEKNTEVINERNKSCLIQELSKLKESSKEAVEGLNTFSDFKKYMHITRDAQNELEDLILKANDASGAQLILVCGSVGDGKSHIISYFKDKYPNEMKNFTLHNDATESLEPSKTSMDTLNDVLDNFSDEKVKISNEKFILAINLGTLNNFIDSDYGDRFEYLREYVKEKKILETTIANNSFDLDKPFQFVNFSDYHIFTLKNGNVNSNYVKSLINKVTDKSEVNVFYKSYKNNCIRCKNCDRCPVKANYEFLSNEEVQNSIVKLLVQCIIKKKIIVSTRALLNFLYELIIARSYVDVNSPMFKDKIGKLNNLDYIKSLTPNIIFNHKDLSFIFEALNTIDPLNTRNVNVDDFIIKFNNSTDIMSFFKEYIDYPTGYLANLNDVDFEITEDKKIKYELLKLFIRSYYLCGKGNVFSLNDEIYDNFIRYMYLWNKGDKSIRKTLYSEVRDGILKWNGEAEKGHINIFIGKNQIKYKTSEEIDLKIDISNIPSNDEVELIKFVTTLDVRYKNDSVNGSYGIEIDYLLFELLSKVNKGYRPNKKDKNHFINFIEFINKIESVGSQKDSLTFVEKNREENKKYKLEYNEEYEEYRFVEM